MVSFPFSSSRWLRYLSGSLQAGCLSLAAALGHRLSEVGEEDGDKEDDADKDVVQADIVDAVGGPEELGEDGEQQGDDKADLNHKHDRIVHHIFGVQLGERPITEDLKMSFVTNLVRCLSFIGNP